MDRANKEIRERITESGLCYWQVADALQITDGNFSRKLRHELPQEEKVRVLQIINSLAAEETEG